MKREKLMIAFLLIIMSIFYAYLVSASTNSTGNYTNQTGNNTTANITSVSNFSIPSLEDNGTSDEEKEIEEEDEETKIIYTPRGARIRLLQLQISIERRMLHMEKVIEKLQERTNISQAQINELKAILDEMDVISKQVGDEANNIEGKTAQELVKIFVGLKMDAKALVREFRNKIKDFLSPQEKEELRKLFKKLRRDKIEKIRERLKREAKEYNKERIREIFGENKETLKEIIERYDREEITKEELVKLIREKFERLKFKIRERIENKLNEKEREIRVKAKSDLIEFKKRYRIEREKRILERLNKLEGLKKVDKDELKKRLRKKIRSGDNKFVAWVDATRLINKGDVVEIKFKTYPVIEIKTKAGREIKTLEPRKGKLNELIKSCGNACKGIKIEK